MLNEARPSSRYPMKNLARFSQECDWLARIAAGSNFTPLTFNSTNFPD